MGWADAVMVLDAAALAAACVAFVWAGGVAWGGLAKPAAAVRRPATWYGERAE